MSAFRVLNFSGGRQSTWLLEKLLRKEIQFRELVFVLNANPGMERQRTLDVVKEYSKRCQQAGIWFEVCKGPNLYEDIVNFRCHEHPPFYVRNEKGKIGKISHRCTRQYKIFPIRRAIRRICRNVYFTKKPWSKMVNQMIGFSAEEAHRIKTAKPSDPAYIELSYPMIEMGVTVNDVVKDFKRWGVEMPSMSLCNGCFALGLREMKKMYEEGSRDWDQLVSIDRALAETVFDGLDGECFVSPTGFRVWELAGMNFELDSEIKTDKFMCNSGMCFV